ncbi:Rv3654c family TadE-like protein [Leifsonia sp. YIM 134122]|uniref:Rv3654c family TadE-like protein n=1 Tax=Leifsonia stereocauli TaxID=3134136 RepID=A0ABU9W6M4_9MICO
MTTAPRTGERTLGDDRGSGTVLAVALIGAVVALALVAASVLGALVVRQRVSAAADAAAIAGADVAMGAVAGVVCDAAAQAAEANAAGVDDCSVDGETVTVEVSAMWVGIPVRARSRAGPAPG